MKNKNKKRIVLLDAHAIIHRAYHALPDFATSGGEPTGALYGFCSMILKIASDLKPDYVIACYDLPKPTYRHEVYDGYKAGRAKTDDDLSLQLEKSKEICEALNIPIYSKEGFEADDMLGTIVELMKGKDMEIVIASGDMDTLQLVDDDYVKVYTLKKGINDTVLYDEKAVFDRFGFEPKLLPDYKGLRGDPSDNIIGVPGIGEKTATELIKDFGTIENIYKEIKTKSEKLKKVVKPRILEILESHEEEALFSKMLGTIRRDAPIDFSLPEKEWMEGIDLEKAGGLFRKLEFRNMGERLKKTVEDVDQQKNFSSEKSSPARHASQGDAGGGRPSQSSGLNRDFSSENFHSDQREDLEELKVALWVVDSNITNPKVDDIFDFAKTKDFGEARKIIFNQLKEKKVDGVFENIEKPLIPILEETKRHGVLVDKDFLFKLGEKYSKELNIIESKIWQLAGLRFNVSSPKQLGEVLFEKLGLSIKNQKKTSLGAKSTKESELDKMRHLHPVVPLILEYRELSKLISTYIEPIIKALDQGGRLHSRFVQTGAATGRMSSESPNLQNIPIGSERGREIRKAFLAPKGSKLLALDYSQIELRIAAILSGDEKLVNIFKENKDVHAAVASEVFKVPENEVAKEMRRQAKVINFGILYGMGVTALQVNLSTDRKTSQEFLNAYFEKFSGVAKYLDSCKKSVADKGYTETLFGRKRYFAGINSKIPYIKAATERMAINAPIQGTSADIIKIAMIRINDFIKKEKFSGVHLLMQIHDELIYEIEDGKVAEFAMEAKKIMENVLTPEENRGVPIVTNVSVGDNWGEMVDLRN